MMTIGSVRTHELDLRSIHTTLVTMLGSPDGLLRLRNRYCSRFQTLNTRYSSTAQRSRRFELLPNSLYMKCIVGLAADLA